jgi:hypothetical protein
MKSLGVPSKGCSQTNCLPNELAHNSALIFRMPYSSAAAGKETLTTNAVYQYF